jgi:hypothetical protein
LDGAARYQIVVQGRVALHWTDCFDQLRLSTATLANGVTVTILDGEVADQAVLHGILMQIRNLGLPLLSVQCLSVPVHGLNE